MLIFIVTLMAGAHTLDGDWVRVADGCRSMAQEDVRRLPETGGFDDMQRRLVLRFEVDRFVAAAARSPRCAWGHVRRGPELVADHPFCGRARTNSGTFTPIDAHHFILVSDDPDIDAEENPWGVLFRHFRFELRDETLILESPQSECGDGIFKMYFVRPPSS